MTKTEFRLAFSSILLLIMVICLGTGWNLASASSKAATGQTSLSGAYYAKAFYYAQNVNNGAIREVACKKKTDTAISGGVQTLGVNGSPSKISSSFVGRINYKTNTPIAGRHDGWIVQFDVNWAPQNARLWALCVPNLIVPEVQTFFETS